MAGALPSIINKLADLATGEYNLQKGLKGEVKLLQAELESMKGALEDISTVPAEQLPNGDKIWARNVRELSYDIEDNIDTFMVRCKGDQLAAPHQHGYKNAIRRCLDLLMQPMIRHKIATEIRAVKSRVVEVHKLHKRYRIDTVSKAGATTIDPRLMAHNTKMAELVGIREARDELIDTMMQGNEVSVRHGNIVSIVGFGGLGKTTLANSVYEKLRSQFDCSASVVVSQTPDMKKVFKGLLRDLGKNITDETLDERQLIKVLEEFLQEKRYFIVIDEIWDISVWKIIKCALPDNAVGYTIITTTRNFDIAQQVGGAYKLKPLSLKNSRKLLYRRIFGNETKYNNEETEHPSEELAEVSDRILKKCAGVPLAIITIASILVSKGRNIIDWYEVYTSIGKGLENSLDLENMRKILLLSYYDLPCHLKACLLYLSLFPEDIQIGKDKLIWMWIAEGFIQCKKHGESLLELGESYFNELVNRNIIQLVNHDYYVDSEYCRVHDMVLDVTLCLSSEENFTTILNGNMDHTSPSITIRRLSLQNGKADHTGLRANICSKIRSVLVFFPGNDLMLDLRGFRVLRVLDLEHCRLSSVHRLKYLGQLIHLRYLGLRGTYCKEQLPEEIGKLRFLLSLDIRDTGTSISNFPSSVFHLKHLRCLHINSYGGVPNGISNLTSLEVLTLLWICDATNIIEIGHLTELRSEDTENCLKHWLHRRFGETSGRISSGMPAQAEENPKHRN